MAHLQGFTNGAISNMLNHYTRHNSDPEQEKYRYGNQMIDPSRTHLNYALFEREDPQAFIEEKIAATDTKPTKATNVISDIIITLPDNEKLVGREHEFFKQSYEFVVGKVGAENIVGAWVHMDETSPHIHICFVPSSEKQVMTNDKNQPLRWTLNDEKKNPKHKAGEVKRDKKGTVRYKRIPALDNNGDPIVKRTISQSAIFDRTTMKSFHPDLTTHMRKHFGFDVGVELEDEGDKLLSKLNHSEYKAAKKTLERTKRKAEKSNAEIERLKDKRQEIQQQTAEETERLERLQRTRATASERVDALESIATNCRIANATTARRKGEVLRCIVDLCARCATQFGLGGKVAAATMRTALTIGLRNTNVDAGIRIANNQRTSQNNSIRAIPQLQQQKHHQLQR